MHGFFEGEAVSGGGKMEFFVEGVEAEVVAVGAAWRTGSDIFRGAGVVAADHGVGRDGVFGDGAGLGSDVPDEPVGPDAHGGIGVVDDEDEAFGFGWNTADDEGRADVAPVGGEAFGHGAAFVEGAGGDIHG